jgi:hypothetical protein
MTAIEIADNRNNPCSFGFSFQFCIRALRHRPGLQLFVLSALDLTHTVVGPAFIYVAPSALVTTD